MLPGYFDAVTGIFLQWRKKSADEQEKLPELAQKAANIILGGISAVAE